LVTGFSDLVCNIKVPSSTHDWTSLCHRRGHYIGVRSETFLKNIYMVLLGESAEVANAVSSVFVVAFSQQQ
jgi:hypothetical protein